MIGDREARESRTIRPIAITERKTAKNNPLRIPRRSDTRVGSTIDRDSARSILDITLAEIGE
jgi:hypothetical protein